MARAKKKAEAESPDQAPVPVGIELPALLLLPFACGLLAVFQWMELLISQLGGEVSCAIGERFNCIAVWASPAAKAIHRMSGMPLAGWGLIWSVSAFGVGLWLLHASMKGGGRAAAPMFAARILAAAGVLTSVALFGITLQLGSFCLTCLATYALVAGYALAASRLKPDRSYASVGVVAIAAPISGLLLASYLALLLPASRTPVEVNFDLGIKKPAPSANAPSSKPAPPTPSHPEIPVDDPLAAYIAELPGNVRQALSDAMEGYRRSKNVDTSRFRPRRMVGPANAAITIVDFSDLRCGHCKMLAETMEQLEGTAKGAFRHESRWFPLDGGCNPKVPPAMVDATGVRCMGARAMICLESSPAYDSIRRTVFSEQQNITLDRILALAEERAQVKRAALEACMGSKETAAKLSEDIEFASLYGIDGTPLVLMNGREGSPIGPFLYGMILAQGNANAPGFGLLPAPVPHDHEHEH